MRFGRVAVDQGVGALLAHSVSLPGRTWPKATKLSAEDVAEMKRGGLSEIVVAQLEEGDVDENIAATMVAAALAAPGIEIRPAATGRVNLYAEGAGVFTVSRSAVDAINAVDPAITLATLANYSVVERGTMVATIKIIPFALPSVLAEGVANLAAGENVIRLSLFQSHHVGLAQTLLPSVKDSVLDKTGRRTAERLARSGSVITQELRTGHDASELAIAVQQLASANDIVIVFGASAIADPQDVIPEAIRLAGGIVHRVGMPVDPGNLLVLGKVGDATVIGAPGCARSPKLNGFDWVLDRLAAGMEVCSEDVAAMGVGGLLMEIETRPQPRAGRDSRTMIVDAIVLAAGQGLRMGGPNKLMAEFGGKPLIRHVGDLFSASTARSVIVVAGHQGERVTAALEGSRARIVHNPDFQVGLSSSLKAGIQALPSDTGGALVALGDMPMITTAQIDLLIREFVKAEGKAIVRATHAGKRGNPVILPRALFSAVMTLAGDVGARHLVETSEMAVIDVEIGEGANFDVDTPNALALAGGVLID